MRVLVTNAESTGLYVTRSLGMRGMDVVAASHLARAMAFHSRYCSERAYYPNPKGDESKIVDKLISILESKKIGVFFPLGEEIMMAVSRNMERFRNSGSALIPFPDHDTMDKTDDKSRTITEARKIGIEVPRTYLAGDGSLEIVKKEFEFPVVIKPHRGEGSAGHSIISSPKDLERRFRETVAAHGPSMIQEFVWGDKYSSTFVFDENSKPVRACVFKMVRQFPLTGGPMLFSQTVKHDESMDLGINIFRHLGWKGIGQTEIIKDSRDGRLKFIEINPRFFGSTPVTMAAGVDFAWTLHRMALGERVSPDLTYRVGVKARLLFPNDVRHLFSVLTGGPRVRGFRNPSKMKTIKDFLRFHEKDLHYYIFTRDDPMPAIFNAANFIYKNLPWKH